MADVIDSSPSLVLDGVTNRLMRWVNTQFDVSIVSVTRGRGIMSFV